jgi:transcriptional regulator with XRE-family HTH domain
MDVEHASPRIDGAKLRRLRKEARLSITGFAATAGIAASYVSAIECGHRPTVSPPTYGRIIDALGVNYDTLIKAEPTAAAA